MSQIRPEALRRPRSMNLVEVCSHSHDDWQPSVQCVSRDAVPPRADRLDGIFSQAVMRVPRCALLASALALTFCALAVAAAMPKAHIDYIYLRPGVIAVNLATGSAKQLMASKPRSAVFPSSSLLVLCQGTTGATTELQMGFPGATLKLRKRHYGFRVSYTENRADLVTFGTPMTIAHESAHATVTGTIENAKLIAGTISVTANGCNLKASKYKATPFKSG
jgi:hypothetical protein